MRCQARCLLIQRKFNENETTARRQIATINQLATSYNRLAIAKQRASVAGGISSVARTVTNVVSNVRQPAGVWRPVNRSTVGRSSSVATNAINYIRGGGAYNNRPINVIGGGGDSYLDEILGAQLVKRAITPKKNT